MPKPENDNLPDTVEQLICFALYSANNAMNRAYKPHLAALGLTYPQYIALTALWEKDGITVGTLCDRLMIETNTLTPVLKKLEAMGHVTRRRGDGDERQVFVHLTDQGRTLRKKAPDITACIIENTGLPLARLEELVTSISQMRDNLATNKKARK